MINPINTPVVEKKLSLKEQIAALAKNTPRSKPKPPKPGWHEAGSVGCIKA